MKWKCTTIDIVEGQKPFEIWHTLPTRGNVNTIEAAVDNWQARTSEYTQQSLIDYINSKRLKGMAPDFYASKFKPA